MPHVGLLQWALTFVLLTLGLFLAVRAWQMARKEPESEPRIEVLAGIGGGLVCGIAVGLSALFMSESIRLSQEHASWRAAVESAATIPGFAATGHDDVRTINFSGKSLHDANFDHADLHGAQFRDADLTAATLEYANLRDANLIGANLSTASLKHAVLDGASLHTANLNHADLRGASFSGAKVNARTCWPTEATAKDLARLLRHVVAQKHADEATGSILTPEAEEKEDGLAGGQQAPNCDLWKYGLRLHPEGPVTSPGG